MCSPRLTRAAWRRERPVASIIRLRGTAWIRGQIASRKRSFGGLTTWSLSHWNIRRGLLIDQIALRRTLSWLIQYHAPLGNTSEVAWALWGAILFNESVDTPAVRAIESMKDSVVALLALDAQQRSLLAVPPSTTVWAAVLDDVSDLYAEHWLLAYEANVKGWLTGNNGDQVANDPAFSHLKVQGVYFYDGQRFAPDGAPGRRGPGMGITPEFVDHVSPRRRTDGAALPAVELAYPL